MHYKNSITPPPPPPPPTTRLHPKKTTTYNMKDNETNFILLCILSCFKIDFQSLLQNISNHINLYNNIKKYKCFLMNKL